MKNKKTLFSRAIEKCLINMDWRNKWLGEENEKVMNDIKLSYHLWQRSTSFSLNYQGMTTYSSSKGVAPSVEAFDKLMNNMVAEFLKKSKILAGDVETHVSTVLSCPPWKDNKASKG